MKKLEKDKSREIGCCTYKIANTERKDKISLTSDARDLRLLEGGAPHRARLVRADASRRHLASAERRLPPPKSFIVAGRRATALRPPPQVHLEEDQGRSLPRSHPVPQQPAEVLPQGWRHRPVDEVPEGGSTSGHLAAHHEYSGLLLKPE